MKDSDYEGSLSANVQQENRKGQVSTALVITTLKEVLPHDW